MTLRIDGMKVTAEMLAALDKETRDKILQNVATVNPELVKKLLGRMFTFEDLAKATDRQIQDLLKQVPQKRLVLAMRTATPALQELIFRNHSTRAAKLLREEVASLGPQKKSEVEAAQAEILEIAKTLGLDANPK